jgi:hypothetical protein
MLCLFASRCLAIWTLRPPYAQDTASEDDSEESGGGRCEEYPNIEVRESRLDVIEAREVVQSTARKSSSRAGTGHGCGNQHRVMGKTGSSPRTSEAFTEAPKDDCAEFHAGTRQDLTGRSTHKRHSINARPYEDDYDAVDDEEEVASLRHFARWQKEKRDKSLQERERMRQWRNKSLFVMSEMLEARMTAEDALHESQCTMSGSVERRGVYNLHS